MKSGIAVAGTILVDKINEISSYPKSGELTQIKSVQKSVGGCVPNVAIDLKRICPDLTVKAAGKIGADENGEYVKNVLSDNGVNIENISVGGDKTSFTEVMSVTGGQRTFFTYAGASADFGVNDVGMSALNVKMLHLGYFLLLDKIDNGDGEILLKKAKENGVKTSIDLVSESSGDFFKITSSALKYCNYVIINEIEASSIANIPVRDDCGVLIEENVKPIMQKLIDLGVKEKVIVHCPECGYLLSSNGEFTSVKSKKIPKGFIKGSVGAGDAFCAGSLYAFYNGYTDARTLEFANLVAISCLSEKDSVSGIKSKEELEKIFF